FKKFEKRLRIEGATAIFVNQICPIRSKSWFLKILGANTGRSHLGLYSLKEPIPYLIIVS
ncbi:unnamed protein product, partial [Nesidiocoris tenuis]